MLLAQTADQLRACTGPNYAADKPLFPGLELHILPVNARYTAGLSVHAYVCQPGILVAGMLVTITLPAHTIPAIGSKQCCKSHY